MARSTPKKAQEDVRSFSELNVGDRVMRQRVLGSSEKGFYRGEIVRVKVRPGLPPLYDVRWDHDTTTLDTGYMAHGLMLELIN